MPHLILGGERFNAYGRGRPSSIPC